jgi:hypothetical protein
LGFAVLVDPLDQLHADLCHPERFQLCRALRACGRGRQSGPLLTESTLLGVALSDGSQISGAFTIASAQNRANELQSGALPVRLALLSRSRG